MAVWAHAVFDFPQEKAIRDGAADRPLPFGIPRVFMNQVTVAACVLFILAMAVETTVRLIFLRFLEMRHPGQWQHAAQPALWMDRTILSARSMMLYLQRRTYLASVDWDGGSYCDRHRTIMLTAYWFTVTTGATALIAIALYGW